MSIENFLSLDGRTALVTGASRGLGRAIAIGLCNAGARVVLVGRSGDALEETRALLPDPDRGRCANIDITNEAAVVAMANDLRTNGWAPDVIVNNAGTIDRAGLDDIETDSFAKVVDTNLTAAMVVTRTFAPDLRNSTGGRVVNVASALGIVGKANAAAYVASKHALVGLTRALSAELGPSGVTINALCPGYTRTDINVVLQQDPEFNQSIINGTALKRWGVPEEMVGPTLFLCSPMASYMTGQTLVVDGGLTAII